MQTAAIPESCADCAQEEFDHSHDCEIIELATAGYPGESLFFDFANEIDAWARQALAATGFGDF
jgi:hypothetical protein